MKKMSLLLSLMLLADPCFLLSQEPAPRDSSFVIISAIKSVAGEKPANEFFDINVKFNFSDLVFVLTSADIAFSSVGTDSVQSQQKKLTEAGISLNWAPVLSQDSMRRIVFGLATKIFSEIPYIGVQLGGMESGAKSPLFSSYVLIGYYWRGQFTSERGSTAGIISEAPHSFYVEFALHSPKVEFLKFLRLKGGILLPVESMKITSVQSRIVIEIPIGSIARF